MLVIMGNKNIGFSIPTILLLQLLLLWQIISTACWTLAKDDSNIFDVYKDGNVLTQNAFELRSKRSIVRERQLPNEPTLFKFEISDAVEPSEDVKAMLRQQRAYNAENTKSGRATTTLSTTTTTTTRRPTSVKSEAKNRSNNASKRKSKRNKRATSGIIKDFNHNGIKLIRFEVSDAREPDEKTKVIIKRMRQMEFENMENNKKAYEAPVTPNHTKSSLFKRNIMQIKSTKNRSKRSTRLNKPQMVQFELSDARVSFNTHNNNNNKNDNNVDSLQRQVMRKNRQLEKINYNSTTFVEKNKNSTLDDLNTDESKRYYFFQEAPAKIKKSYEEIPPEVQHVMQLLNNNINAKSYVKHIPMQQLDIGPMKTSFYTTKYAPPTRMQPVAYVKYIRPYQQKVPVSPAPVITSAQVESSPVGMSPIVVKQANELQAQPYNVRFSEHNSEIKFRPSKPDTFLEQGKNTHYFQSQYHKENEVQELNDDKISPQIKDNQIHYHVNSKSNSDYEQAIEGPQSSAKDYVSYIESKTESPVIKIEYHVPATVHKVDYKDFEEFKRLSALVGKSPQDQMHGLTYLLAKEMQNKLNAQHHAEKEEQTSYLSDIPEQIHRRPQDSTSPIVFHPEESEPEQDIEKSALPEIQSSEKVYGMGKTKAYVPIVEHSANSVGDNLLFKSNVFPTSSSFIQYDLYTKKSDYNSDNKNEYSKLDVKSHYAKAAPKIQETNYAHQSSSKYAGNNDKLEYASKYKFGYRIRDFHTGNDFGHKQNRDLHGVTRGQYHILLPDGRIQNVIYHADDSGFHADVSFEGETK